MTGGILAGGKQRGDFRLGRKWLGGKWWGDFNQIQEENGRGEWQGENSRGKMAGGEMAVRA